MYCLGLESPFRGVTIATGPKAPCLQVNIVTRVQRQRQARAGAELGGHSTGTTPPALWSTAGTEPPPDTLARLQQHRAEGDTEEPWGPLPSEVRKKKPCRGKGWITQEAGAKCNYLLEWLSFNRLWSTPGSPPQPTSSPVSLRAPKSNILQLLHLENISQSHSHFLRFSFLNSRISN